MAAKIIDGKALAEEVKREVKANVEVLARRGLTPHLVAILVGDAPEAQLYAVGQKRSCEAVGIRYELLTLPPHTDSASLVETIKRLNADPAITGIMLHLPLPPHLDVAEVQYQIDPLKDVEGVNPANIGYAVYRHTLIAPSTALSAIRLIESTRVPLRGAEAVIVGASDIVGKPASILLTERMATVTLCHIATRDLAKHTSQADIIVVAVGKPNLIRAEHVREGAIVIDVGINSITLPNGKRKTVGDVDFEAVKEKAGYITPVPGGVGPMTVAMLLENTLRCAALTLKVDLADDSVPATTQGCPLIPVRHLQGTLLRDLLKDVLKSAPAGEGISINDIYDRVVAAFGVEGCKPYVNCPHYSTPHAEYKHVTRLALWDGQRRNLFQRIGQGSWRLA
jgi:methylenetetrahydrofolate dehydrogenase (NADP+)/methenyltetrahydrofolate cyclohydrolase